MLECLKNHGPLDLNLLKKLLSFYCPLFCPGYVTEKDSLALNSSDNAGNLAKQF